MPAVWISENIPMNTERIEERLLANLTCEYLHIDGDGRHFQALVVSPEFAGENRVQRQQRVHAALGELLETGELHALSFKTLTPEEWSTQRG